LSFAFFLLLLLLKWCYFVRGMPGLGPAAEVLSFASPKESTQRKGEPETVPCGYPALLASDGVWLNSLRSNNASPDPPAAALLGTVSMAGERGSGNRIPRASSLALTLHVDWVVSRVAPLALGTERSIEGKSGCWLFREFAMAKPSKRSSVPTAVVTGRSSAAAGGSGWRMFEAKPSLRQTRPLRAAQGTAQRPCLRLAFLLLPFLWRSKEKEGACRGATRPATKEKT
jgi:hypothetical protein